MGRPQDIHIILSPKVTPLKWQMFTERLRNGSQTVTNRVRLDSLLRMKSSSCNECWPNRPNVASKLYGVNATIIMFVFVLYCNRPDAISYFHMVTYFNTAI